MKGSLRIIYIGKVAPYEPEFYNMPGYGDAGTLAQLGFIEALYCSGLLDYAWGFRPIAHWPRVNIQFEKIRRHRLPCGAELHLFPLFNHFLLREISWFISVACCVLWWSISNIGKKRILITYNLSQPNGVVWARLWSWITHTKLVPIVYDMAQIKSFKKSFLVRMTEPDWLDRVHEKFLPRCDGLITITDAIIRDFAPKVSFLRVDGGVGDAVVNRLPLLERSRCEDKVENGALILMYAGSLAPWNCVKLMLDYMAANKGDKRLELWIAGAGSEEDFVREAAANDGRIKFFGMLRQDKLYELYSKADVLLNLRDVMDPGLVYHYPSKTFEMLAMGKPTIMSNGAHTKSAYGDYCKVIDRIDVACFAEGVDFFRKMTAEQRFEYGRIARQFILKNRQWSCWGSAIGKFLKSI